MDAGDKHAFPRGQVPQSQLQLLKTNVEARAA
jgi:hypothetical protein